ncbi:MAG: pentapeptide repeat-containing protein [Chitinophagales bacterium]|nr:pentapeptide repeat-containing protein [Chitinophagales bacterium]
MTNYYEETFNEQDYIQSPLPKGEYEDCTFTACDFSGSDVQFNKFIHCTFRDCNFSLALLAGSMLSEVAFVRCKLLGVKFEDCNPFNLEMAFEDCNLQHASFFELKLKNTPFKRCKLLETDFSGADLSGADFSESDLSGATFGQTRLEKADFSSAVNYTIDPDNNHLRGARFAAHGLAGLLSKYKIIIT